MPEMRSTTPETIRPGRSAVASPTTGGSPPSRGSTREGFLRWRTLRWLLLAGAALLLLVQVVPYGRSHTNPPVTGEPRWNSPQTRELTARACFDCHSNLTTWPWYSNVAPVSWLVQRDVDGGRRALNFSEWNKPQDGAGDVAEAISDGSMPPWFFTIMHSKSNLSKADRQRLIVGLTATFRSSPPIGGSG